MNCTGDLQCRRAAYLAAIVCATLFDLRYSGTLLSVVAVYGALFDLRTVISERIAFDCSS